MLSPQNFQAVSCALVKRLCFPGCWLAAKLVSMSRCMKKSVYVATCNVTWWSVHRHKSWGHLKMQYFHILVNRTILVCYPWPILVGEYYHALSICPSIHLSNHPAFIITLQPTIFNRSCFLFGTDIDQSRSMNPFDYRVSLFTISADGLTVRNQNISRLSYSVKN